RVERLEQRHDVPDRRQRVAVAVAEPRVVPAQAPVVPARLGGGDAVFGQAEVVLLGGAQRRLCGDRGRGADAEQGGSAEQGDELPSHLRPQPNRRPYVAVVATVSGPMSNAETQASALERPHVPSPPSEWRA